MIHQISHPHSLGVAGIREPSFPLPVSLGFQVSAIHAMQPVYPACQGRDMRSWPTAPRPLTLVFARTLGYS